MASIEVGLKRYEYLSRYASVPVMRDLKDGTQYHGTVSWIRDDIPYNIHKVKMGDTLYKLALLYYGNPTLYWVIADFNKIINVDIPLKVDSELKIISLNDIEFRKRF
jgi:hypothetical protein